MRVSKRFRKRNKDYFAGIGAEEKMVKFPGESPQEGDSPGNHKKDQ